jgi:hypothetical protein
MSIYGRLGFNSSDPTTNATVSNYSSGVANNMALMPPLLNAWQTEDISTSNVGSYFVNPVAGITATISSTMSTINTATIGINVQSTISSTVTQALRDLGNTAATAVSSAANYLYVTNRESNVVDPGTDVTTVHYKMAIGYGKIMSYITYQSDGVQNNSPIMGNFTSITLGNTLNTLSNTLTTQQIALSASITMGTPNTSTFTLAQTQALQSTVSSINTLMTTYPAQDNAFFTNTKSVMADYSTVSPLGDMGATETLLVNTYIGTDKLKTRILSQTQTANVS